MIDFDRGNEKMSVIAKWCGNDKSGVVDASSGNEQKNVIGPRCGDEKPNVIVCAGGNEKNRVPRPRPVAGTNMKGTKNDKPYRSKR